MALVWKLLFILLGVKTNISKTKIQLEVIWRKRTRWPARMKYLTAWLVAQLTARISGVLPSKLIVTKLYLFTFTQLYQLSVWICHKINYIYRQYWDKNWLLPILDKINGQIVSAINDQTISDKYCFLLYLQKTFEKFFCKNIWIIFKTFWHQRHNWMKFMWDVAKSVHYLPVRLLFHTRGKPVYFSFAPVMMKWVAFCHHFET